MRPRSNLAHRFLQVALEEARRELDGLEQGIDVNAFGGENGVMNTLKRENMNMLMIGTVKNDLLGALESAVQNTDGSFKVYNVASGSAYTIFMLAEERFWGFTDVAPISVGNGIEAYTINVMW